MVARKRRSESGARYQGIETGAHRHNRGNAASLKLVDMAPPWKTFQRFAENLVFNEAPKFIRQQLQTDTVTRGIQQGIKLGIDAIVGRSTPRRPARSPPAAR